MKKNSCVKLLIFVITVTIGIFTNAYTARAEEKIPEIILEDGGDTAVLSDGDYYTTLTFSEGNRITVKSAYDDSIFGIYIIWNGPVEEWTLETDDKSIQCGKKGFLHEYINIKEGTKKAVINITGASASICDIRIFSSGKVPDDVQQWKKPCERADMMLVASHADDEILFFGGIIPTYGVEKNAKVQVVYMAQFWDSAPVREHEKLDGLWEEGCIYYPVSGEFNDLYSETLEEAKTQYDEEALIEFVVEQIRRFSPQVVVSHDFNGEYGHGFHRLTAEAVKNALEDAAKEGEYTASMKKYGVWDTPKAYFHLYEKNKLHLNLREPLSKMQGRTALEVAQEAYKKHVSQQWCWFYVSDDYEYSCADFGLYRTKVGKDLKDDMLDNLKTYKVQEAESREQESIKRAEEESIRESQAESLRQAEEESQSIKEGLETESEPKGRNTKKLILIIAIIAVTVIISVVAVDMLNVLKRYRKKENTKRRKKKVSQNRMKNKK